MKAKTIISCTLCSLLLATSAMAQDANRALAKIHYIFKHLNDTTARDKFLRDEVVTYLGKTGSYYSSYSSTRAKEEVEKQLKDPAFDGNLTISKNTTGIQQSYLFDHTAQKLSEVVSVGSESFLLDDHYATQDWEILADTKTIGGYTCQKAETTFKGRHYTAWFTTELPFMAGPWKLHGLPGLILEAYDEKKEVQFEYSGFDKLEEVNARVAAPEKALPSSRADVAKLQQAFSANPQAYLNAKRGAVGASVSSSSASSGGGGGTIVFTSGGSSSGTSAPSMDMSRIKSMNVKNADDYKPSRTTNNPIELTP